jgi:hypothetical protein
VARTDTDLRISEDKKNNVSTVVLLRAVIAQSVWHWATGWTIGVRFLAGAGNFSLHHRVQNGSGAHPASYPVGIRCSFAGGKAAGA